MKFALIALLLTAASFSQALGQTTAPADTTAPAGAAPVSMGNSTDHRQPLTDSQIADIVKTANDVDIHGGKTAEKKATRSDVKAFAKEMIKDDSEARRF